jgi:KipI family sensor histidine kinase inhibitor
LSVARLAPLGSAGFCVELGDSLAPETNARVRALDRELARRPFDGFREAVPTLRSLLVLYDTATIRPAAVARELESRLARLDSAPAAPARLHELKTRYGGEDGPDLEALARARALSEREVIALHTAGEYTAFMLGFKPGFAYLGLVPEPLECSRHKTPRVRVPAGSVGIAGRQTGVYPVSSPGGWQLIGRTTALLFDPWRDEPSLIAPGDRVRFVAVPELEAPARPAPARPAPSPPPIAIVREPGLLTTVQDGGRFGHRRWGVGCAGPVDAAALAASNRAVGNRADAAALECTVAGPLLEFLAPVHFAVAGADLGAVLERADLGEWPLPRGASVLARPGNRLRFAGRRDGCRAYVALRGGIDVPPVLGSRSTDLASGFGGLEGRAIQAGDRIAVLPGKAAEGRGSRPEPYAGSVRVRVVLGPQEHHFAADAVARFLEDAWRVAATSDRIGLRLEAEPLRHRGASEILSDGMVAGSIQVPPDGKPIVMLADGPTTGGYPKIATVLAADLPLLAQLVPGEGEVRFEKVALEDL